MIKKVSVRLLMAVSVTWVSGCSSVMTHTGGEQGCYPGTRASYEILTSDSTGWTMKPLIALDMPFSAVMDTIMLPWDLFRKETTVKSRVHKSEQETLATNAVIPPAP